MSPSPQSFQPDVHLSNINPERILSILQAYRDAAALQTAIDLELFTRIAHGTTTVSGLALELRIPVRGLRVLCTYLQAAGLISTDGDELRLPDDAAAFLDKNSATYLGDAAGALHSTHLLRNFERLTEAVRAGVSGESVNANSKVPSIPALPAWFDITRGRTERSAAIKAFAEALILPPSQPLKILDLCPVDAGFGIALAEKFPQTIIVALDTPEALRSAQERATRAKLGTRYQNIPGDPLLAPLGFEYDAVLMAGALHRFDVPQLKSLFMRLHQALKKSSQLIILDCLWEEQSGSNALEKELAGLRLNMLAATDKGDAYSLAEVKELLAGAEFKSIESHPLAAAKATMLIARF